MTPLVADGLEVAPVAVDDDAFGDSAYRVLRATELTQQERINLLAGVVRRQLTRAEERFLAGSVDAGLSAFRGAALMLRAGEHRSVMFQGAAEALENAAAEVARLGNEGQALAIYGRLAEILPEADERRADVATHLAALDTWNREGAQQGPLQSLAFRQHVAVQRALLEATGEALQEATDALVEWMHRAIEADLGERPIRSKKERDEAMAAYRAVRAGGLTLVGLHIRHGQLALCWDVLEREDLSRLVPPILLERVERAALDDDPRAWAELYALFDSIGEGAGEQTWVDPSVATAAAWGAALELYRLVPEEFGAARPLARALVRFGMAEAVPPLIIAAMGEQPSPEGLSWALLLLQNALVSEDRAGQIASARRTFEASLPLIELSASPAYVGRVAPTAARLRYVMGALEVRSANLTRALPLIEGSVAVEPTIDAWGTLAAMRWQRGERQAAIAGYEKVIEIARRSRQPVGEGAAELALARIHEGSGQESQAQEALQRALGQALDGRRLARTREAHAEAERLLAQVLENYGDLPRAREATERAYDASQSDRKQLVQTTLDAARRALTFEDLRMARNAAQEAIDGGLESEDLVYVALWLYLTERRLGKTSDGTVERALAGVADTERWPARLRDWALGRLDAARLSSEAHDEVERIEAKFYVGALQTTEPGRKARGWAALEEVAKSEAIELVEVQLAKDLLAMHANRRPRYPLPDTVTLP